MDYRWRSGVNHKPKRESLDKYKNCKKKKKERQKRKAFLGTLESLLPI